ncbi:M48 family metallopeptidase [Thalassomonas haliotis]|uniref:Putative beta-barrel assembly-enhancing protease n=1 Tax=Thalassomonas haliotis TaxID=485448 RepID=A0ABY7V906_9GAMM|nr:M48 family metallopeptidase [Thalassomonas haliotis]
MKYVTSTKRKTILFKLKPLLIAISLAAFTGLASGAEADKNRLPEIGTAGGSILSLDKEQQIGDALKRQLRGSQPIINDPVLMEYINDLGNQLVKNAIDVNYPFDFFLINNKELNAFAFFGGHVGVHSGLLTTADNESELASVLAHEISHVTQRHLARRLESQSRTQPLTMAGMLSGVLLTLINPTVGMAALSTSMAAQQQAGINYTRGNEKEADRVGIALLANSDFDPQAAPQFFAKMAEQYRYKSKPPAMLLTHPLPESRISDARLRAQNFAPNPQAPKLSFELAKARIQARYEGNPKDNIKSFNYLIEKSRYKLRPAAEYALALSYFEDKQYQQAKTILIRLFNQDKTNLFYADTLSDVYIQLKQFKQGIGMLSELNLLMPNNQVVALNYANLLMEAKKYQQAADILNDFLLVKPDNFLAYDLLTSVYRRHGKTALMHVNRAETLALLGNYQRAIDELQTGYEFADGKPLLQKRIKARVLQFQEQENSLKRL